MDFAVWSLKFIITSACLCGEFFLPSPNELNFFPTLSTHHIRPNSLQHTRDLGLINSNGKTSANKTIRLESKITFVSGRWRVLWQYKYVYCLKLSDRTERKYNLCVPCAFIRIGTRLDRVLIFLCQNKKSPEGNFFHTWQRISYYFSCIWQWFDVCGTFKLLRLIFSRSATPKSQCIRQWIVLSSSPPCLRLWHWPIHERTHCLLLRIIKAKRTVSNLSLLLHVNLSKSKTSICFELLLWHWLGIYFFTIE